MLLRSYTPVSYAGAIEIALGKDARQRAAELPLAQAMLGVGQPVNRLFGELDRILLRISGRRRPKTIGFGARDVLAIQAPKVCKPSSGLIFESFDQVTLVFHGTYSHTAWPQLVHQLPPKKPRG